MSKTDIEEVYPKLNRAGYFYKLVQHDMSAGFDRTFKYKVGKISIAKKRFPWDQRQICRPGLLHASPFITQTAKFSPTTYPSDDKPPILLLVYGVPRHGLEYPHLDKAGFIRLETVRRLQLHRLFGPNGKRITKFLKLMDALEIDQRITLQHSFKDVRRAKSILSSAARAGLHRVSKYFNFPQSHGPEDYAIIPNPQDLVDKFYTESFQSTTKARLLELARFRDVIRLTVGAMFYEPILPPHDIPEVFEALDMRGLPQQLPSCPTMSAERFCQFLLKRETH